MLPEKAPVRRIISTVVAYALRDGARQIRFAQVDGKYLQVAYRIGNQDWQEKMATPQFVQKPLFDELRLIATNGDVDDLMLSSTKLQLEVRWQLQIQFQNTDGVESALLSFDIQSPSPQNDTDIFQH